MNEVIATGSLHVGSVSCGADKRPVALDRAQNFVSPALVLGKELDFSGPRFPRIL